MSDGRIDEEQDAIEHVARHGERLGGGDDRFAEIVAGNAARLCARDAQRLRQIGGEIFAVMGKRRGLEPLDDDGLLAQADAAGGHRFCDMQIEQDQPALVGAGREKLLVEFARDVGAIASGASRLPLRHGGGGSGGAGLAGVLAGAHGAGACDGRRLARGCGLCAGALWRGADAGFAAGGLRLLRLQDRMRPHQRRDFGTSAASRTITRTGGEMCRARRRATARRVAASTAVEEAERQFGKWRFSS